MPTGINGLNCFLPLAWKKHYFQWQFFYCMLCIPSIFSRLLATVILKNIYRVSNSKFAVLKNGRELVTFYRFVCRIYSKEGTHLLPFVWKIHTFQWQFFFCMLCMYIFILYIIFYILFCIYISSLCSAYLFASKSAFYHLFGRHMRSSYSFSCVCSVYLYK